MQRKNFLFGVGLVALGLVAVIAAAQLSKKQANDVHAKAPGIPEGTVPKMPNTPDMNKLNAMQADIAKMNDEDIVKEIDAIKVKAQQMGILKGGQSANFNLNEHPEAKDMLMRMGLLRVEKAKRERKQANAAPQH